MKRLVFAAVVLIFFGAIPLLAQGTLFYLELQGVAAYSTAMKAVELYSQMPLDAMQKPSLGFDLVRRVSGKNRDFGVLAVQARLAYDQEGDHHVELQVYNAYFRYKAGFADVWVGHNRPAFGLDYSLDSHALLLLSPAMMGYGFERDWGAGLQRDFDWGSAAASLTAGSGMPLYLRGNFLAACRISKGVLARDNFSVGGSLAYGHILDTMGIHLLGPEPLGFTAVAGDAAYMWRNLENRVQVLAGRKAGENILLIFWRTGLNFLEEGRLKIEGQPAVMKTGGDWSCQLAGALTYQLNADFTTRAMVQYDRLRKDTRFVLQLYYYKGL
jgi:hypothetical protein